MDGGARVKVAIVHDYLTQRGGAERVALSLHRLFPDAPIYTSAYDERGTFPGFREAEVRTSFIQSLPHSGGWVRAWLPIYPAAFGSLRLRGYDLVISSSSGWAHGVDAGGALHMCYCHTPPRWLYQTERYLAAGGPLPRWTRPAISPLLAALRHWDRRAATRPDLYIANSSSVAERIGRIYGRRPPVIYPPVSPPRPQGKGPASDSNDPYYLVVSRLLPYKRVDLPIKICSARGTRLLVVGEGPARCNLEAIAGPSVEFLGSVDEQTLASLIEGCRALVQAGEEDFGIAPLEANSLGRPVIAFRGGGAVETVRDGLTGILFDDQRQDAMSRAFDRLEAKTWDPQVLRAHAAAFNEKRFHAEVIDLIRLLTGEAPSVESGLGQRVA